MNNNEFTGPHGKKGMMTGSFETVEASQSQQMFDPSTAHLALNTLNPFHSTSLFYFFIVPHGPLNSPFPLVALKYSFTIVHTAHLGSF